MEKRIINKELGIRVIKKKNGEEERGTESKREGEREREKLKRTEKRKMRKKRLGKRDVK